MDRFPKKNYQEHLHFTFLSGPNVVFSNGEMWKRHSASVKAAFDRDIPVHHFVSFSYELFQRIGKGGVFRFSELVQVCFSPFSLLRSRVKFPCLFQRYTLDVVGTALLGYNFRALEVQEDSFVDHFNRVMNGIASPIRLILPFLDDWFPRHSVIQEVHALNARYGALLEAKKKDLGLDLLSYLLEDSTLSNEELISNFSILFSAGHVRSRFHIWKNELSINPVWIGHNLRRNIYSRLLPRPAPRIPIHCTRWSPLRPRRPRRTHILRPRPPSLPQCLHQRSPPHQQPHIPPSCTEDDGAYYTRQILDTRGGVTGAQRLRCALHGEELDQSGSLWSV